MLMEDSGAPIDSSSDDNDSDYIIPLSERYVISVFLFITY